MANILGADAAVAKKEMKELIEFETELAGVSDDHVTSLSTR